MSVLDTKLRRELWGMRGQALAIALVIVGGVATQVMAVSTYDSLMSTRDAYYRAYRFAEVFASLERAPERLVARIRAMPGVDRVRTRVVAGVHIDVEGFPDPVRGRLISHPASGEPVLNRLYLRRGRMPDPAREEEALVNEVFADVHGLEPGDHLRILVNGRRKRLTLVGVVLSPEYVYQVPPGGALPDFARYGVLWMGREGLAEAYDMEGAFNDLVLTVARGAHRRSVIDRLDLLLEPYGGQGAYGREDQLSDHFVTDELRQLRTTATLFPAIFLGVAAFLLNVVLSRLIGTQRDQIGILKAFGYSNRAVGAHYVKLVLAIVLIGVAGGVALGAWFGRGLSAVYMDFYRFPFLDYVLRPYVVGIAAGVSCVAALSGTLFALRRAVRLSPAQAMQPEAPPVYRATLLERLGLQRWLDQPTRMILRHIERHPLKSLLSVLGIAAACGIMMVGNFQKGAIDFMVEVQFRLSQREDLAVTFVQPTQRRALHELTALPGVHHAEGFRTVPARLIHGHREQRTAIRGVEPGGDLMRVLDARLRPIDLPPAGLVLNEHLASLLDARPGDRLTVEVLEGERPVLRIPVAAAARQYMGVAAYMQRGALNRVLGEGEVVSGAYLAVDAARRSEIFSALAERPRVLGTEVHEASIRSFYEEMAQFMLFFSTIAVLLGAVIAFGVVYNSARIALSERGRELASLRVLGFTRAEAGYILLGELGVLTLAAIPLGLLIGYGLCGFLAVQFQSDLYRIPLVVEPRNYALAALVVGVSAALSGYLVWRRIGRLDLIEVLKTRE